MIGRQVSHFYVIRNIGSGGMGVVYEAQDTRLPRSVAIKFLKPPLARDVEAIRRFKREARLASSLNHPNICTILDVDEGGGTLFIAMELLAGESLRDRLASGAMPAGEILEIGVQVAGALAAAHGQGIMHRDITPGNIFLTKTGVVKLLDFGLAKHFASSDDGGMTAEVLTQTGAVVGTVHYMAPEHFLESSQIDHRCDLYSFGAVLYEMATGARPFEARTRRDVASSILEQPHIPLRQFAPRQPAQLEYIIDRLLAKRPDDRYPTASALRDDLLAMMRRGRSIFDSHTGPDGRRCASLAVLPFEIVGEPWPLGAAFRDGLAEQICGCLTHVKNVRVAPRTSTRHVASASIRDIGKRLNVEAVLEGSVQENGGRIRVIATLVDAADERALFPSITVEHELAELLAAQDGVAREIAGRLAASLARESGASRNPEAFHAFKRGRHLLKRSLGGWRAAIEHFQYAIERDERFALAHTSLAEVYNFLGICCLMKPNVAFGIARQSVERALEVDDSLSPAHTELGLARFSSDWDWDGAEQSYRRAIELDAGNALAHVYYSWLLVLLGREDAAFFEAKAGHLAAPASRRVIAARAETLYLARRYDEAIELCDECLALHPDYVFATHLRGQCYQLKARFDDALRDLERAAALAGRAPFYLGMLGHCYGEAGMRTKVLELLSELDGQQREMYVPPQCYVYLYAGLGDRTRALEYQEQAYRDGASPFNYLAPNIRELYALDPQHKKRLEQMRLVL
jgi:TolB-like protein/tRNA A-37 threonylcarbamoyl transferase component Bud32/Flp pilus assembly protein TadD